MIIMMNLISTSITNRNNVNNVYAKKECFSDHFPWLNERDTKIYK